MKSVQGATARPEDKASCLVEHMAWHGGERSGVGVERGSLSSDPSSRLVPLEAPHEKISSLAVSRSALRETTHRLVRAAAQRLGGASGICVRVVSAAIERTLSDGSRAREWIDVAELRIGLDPDAPLWTRATVLADPHEACWPAGWLDAVARVVPRAQGSACWPRRASIAGEAVRLVYEPFAAADLLRVVAWGWARADSRPARGDKVAAAGIAVRDPGFPGRRERTALDAAGAPAQPYESVVDGRFVAGPTDDGARGRLVQPSWRDPALPGYRSLRLDAPSAPTPCDAVVVESVQIFGPRVLGVVRRGEDPGGGVALAELPDVQVWPHLIRGGCGERVIDATGLVVSVPRLIVAAPR